MTKEKRGLFTKTLAAICSRCPLCNHARARPESWLGRVLNHPLHADHCPLWKAEQSLRPGTHGSQSGGGRP